jgi:SAM-dependent methyltransferase
MEHEAGTERLYIDEHVQVRQDAEAASLVFARAAEAPVEPEKGIVRVPVSRWEEAQRYERRTWMQHGRRAISDRNEYHRERFAGYTSIHGRHFHRAIELGCGPYTNIRYIVPQCRIDEVHLLDPLLNDYLKHPFCRYPGGRLGGLLGERPARWPVYARHPVAAVGMIRNNLEVGGVTGRPVTLVPGMIESYSTQAPFDLVVMINVLEHCQDAERVLAVINDILAPGGVLVYQDKMYESEGVRELLGRVFDAGHPLRVDHAVVDDFLATGYRMLMRAEYAVESAFRGVRFDYSEMYVVAERRSSA